MTFPRYDEYKDSRVEWLGEVPVHWRIKRLRFVSLLNPSKAEVAAVSPDTELSFLPMEAIGEDGSLELERTRPLAEVASGYTYFGEGDVTIAKITPCFENGKGAIMRGLVGGCGFGTTELIVCRPRPNQTSSDYLHWIFVSAPFRKLGEASMYGAGGQKRVPDDFVRDFAIAFPPLPEQSAIAAFLDRETAKIDDLVAEQQNLIALLKEKRQALISHAVTKGLDPDVPMKDSGVEWLGEVPAHWRTHKKLSDITADDRHAFVNGPFGSDLLKSELVEDGVPVIYIRDLKLNGYMRVSQWCVTHDKASQLKFCNVSSGDVLVAKVGDPPGLAVIYPAGEPEAIITQDVIRLRVNADKALPEFLTWLLNSKFGHTQIDSISVESTRTRVSLGQYKQLRFALPPVDEQAAIASYLSDATGRLDALVTEAEATIALLQERRTALISAAVTGKIDVRGQTGLKPSALRLTTMAS